MIKKFKYNGDNTRLNRWLPKGAEAMEAYKELYVYYVKTNLLVLDRDKKTYELRKGCEVIHDTKSGKIEVIYK